MTFRTNFSAAVTAVLAILLLLFGGAAPVAAQFDEPEIPDQVVFPELALEPSDPRLGEQVRAVVRIEIHKGWHVYSVVPAEGDFTPIPTALTLEAGPLEAQGPVYESNPRTANDPVLESVEATRRATLIAVRAPGVDALYRLDIRLQGDGETVFFDP